MYRFLALVLVYVISFTAGAIERPQPMPHNGITHEKQIPVLFAANGDTVASGWGGPGEITVSDPSGVSCSGASGPGGGGYVIRDDAGLAELEQSSLGYPIYWVCPGDYRNAVGGQLNLISGGTARTDAGVVKTMCVSSDMTKNPWERNSAPQGAHVFETAHNYAEECVLPGLQINGDGFWFFHGVTFHHAAYSSDPPVDLNAAEGMVFDRVWVDCSNHQLPVDQVEGSCILVNSGSDDVVVQNSAIGPQAPQNQNLTKGVHVTRTGGSRVFVSNNRFWALGHHAKFGGNGVGGNSGNAFVYNQLVPTVGERLSEFGGSDANWDSVGVKNATTAVTVAERMFDPSTAPHNQLFDTGGTRGCGGAPLLISHGSDDPANPMLVEYNMGGGKRGGGGQFCASALGGETAFIRLSEDPGNTVVRNNFLFDNVQGIAITGTSLNGASYDNIVISQNVLDFADIDASAYQSDAGYHSVDLSCQSPCSEPMARDVKIEFNTYGPIPSGRTHFNADPWVKNTNWSEVTANCNMVQGANWTASNPSGVGNVQLDGTLPGQFQSTLNTTALAADLKSYTLTYDPQNPATVYHTFEDILPQPGISWDEHCLETAPSVDITGKARNTGGGGGQSGPTPLRQLTATIPRTGLQQVYSEQSPFNVPIGTGALYIDWPKLNDGGTNVNGTLSPPTYASFGAYHCDATTFPNGPNTQLRTVNVYSRGGHPTRPPIDTLLWSGLMEDTNPNPVTSVDPTTGHCRNSRNDVTTCDCYMIVYDGGPTFVEFNSFRDWDYRDGYPPNVVQTLHQGWANRHRVLDIDGIGWASTAGGGHCPNHQYGGTAGGTSRAAGMLKGNVLRTPGEPIGHALQVALHRYYLASQGSTPDSETYKYRVSPATCIDITDDQNFGTIPYGSLIAVPPSVDCSARGYTDIGQRACEAMQDYGSFVMDAHESGYQHFYMADQWLQNQDPEVNEFEAAMDDLIANDLFRIIPSCEDPQYGPGSGCYDAKTQFVAKGGGTPRAPNFKAGTGVPPPQDTGNTPGAFIAQASVPPPVPPGTERPILINGYRPDASEFTPVLHPGDTCAAGYTCKQAPSEADSAREFTNADTMASIKAFIENPSNGTVFSFTPGFSNTDDPLLIDRDCSAEPNGCWLFLHDDTGVHPHKLADGEKAILRRVDLADGSHNWRFYRLTFRAPSESGATGQGAVRKDGQPPTVNDITVAWSACEETRFCVHMNQAASGGAADGWDVQWTFARGRTPVPQEDFPAMHVQSSNARIIRNEIVDATDAVVLAQEPHQFDGLLILDNDFYLDLARSDGSGGPGSGTEYSCAENAVDIKASSGNPNNNVIIRRNRIHGYRQPAWKAPGGSSCGAGAGQGAPIVTQFEGDNVDITENIVWDSHIGVMHPNRSTVNPSPKNNTITGNIFDLSNNSPLKPEYDNTQAGYYEAQGEDMLFAWNTLSLHNHRAAFRFVANYGNDFKYNLIIHSAGEIGGLTGSDVRDYNAYVDGIPGVDTNQIIVSENLDGFSFDAHIISGPTIETLAGVRPSAGSALASWVGSQPGQPTYTPGRGIEGGARVRRSLGGSTDLTPGALSVVGGTPPPDIPANLSVSCSHQSGTTFQCAAGWTGPDNVSFSLEHRLNGGAGILINGISFNTYNWTVDGVNGDLAEARVRSCETPGSNCSLPTVWVGDTLSGAPAPSGDVPRANRNGYQPYWLRPIVLATEALDPNWNARTVAWPQLQTGHSYLEPYTIANGELAGLDCSGTVDTQGNWRVLKGPSDLVELSNPSGHRQFAVCPGSYESFGKFSFAIGGSADTDAGVRKVVCLRNDVANLKINPTQVNLQWDQRPDGDWSRPNHDYTKECVFPPAVIEDVSNWFITGISFSADSMVGPAPGFTGLMEGPVLEIKGGTAGITVDRAWVSCFGTATSGSEHDCVRIDSRHVTFQNFMISHPTLYYDANMIALRLGENAIDTRVVEGEIADSLGHGLMVGDGGVFGLSYNNIVEDVDIWKSIRAECTDAAWTATGIGTQADGLSGTRVVDVLGAHSGLIQKPTAQDAARYTCGAGGSPLRITHGSAITTEPLGIVMVRQWGAYPHEHRLGSTSPALGRAVTAQYNPASTFISHGYFEGPRWFGVDPMQDPGSNYSDIVLQYSRYAPPLQDNAYGITDPSAIRVFEVNTGCASNPACDGESLHLYNNSVGPYPDSLENQSPDALGASGDNTVEFSCNWANGSKMAVTGTAVTGVDNQAIDGADLTGWGVTRTVPRTLSEANLNDVAVWTRLQSQSEQRTWESSGSTVLAAGGCNR